MTFKCELCHDTGYYGDDKPGIRGNREYQRCECQCTPKVLSDYDRGHAAGKAEGDALRTELEDHKTALKNADAELIEKQKYILQLEKARSKALPDEICRMLEEKDSSVSWDARCEELLEHSLADVIQNWWRDRK